MSPADPIDRRIRDLDAVVPLQIPDDALRPHAIRAADVQDLLYDFCRRLVGVVVGNAPPTGEPLFAELTVSASPEVADRPRDPDEATTLGFA